MRRKRLENFNLFIISVFISIIYWVVESLMGFYVFKTSQFFEIIPDNASDLWSRIFICALLISFGLYAAYSKQCAQSKEKEKNVFFYKNFIGYSNRSLFLTQ